MVQTYATLETEQSDGWLRVWLNRPQVHNALSGAMIDDLTALFQALHTERSIRGVTLRGRGGTFCAGGDLNDFKALFQGGAPAPDTIMRASRDMGQLLDLINEAPQVTLGLVEGAAMAGGLGILCACDIVAVTQDARFGLTETAIGVTPAQIAPFVVQRIGMVETRKLALTAGRFKGARAGTIGLADHVVPDAAALDAVEQTTMAQVLGCAPGANAVTKSIILATPTLSRAQMRERAAQDFTDCVLSDEGREGVAAFLEKRAPNWVRDPSKD